MCRGSIRQRGSPRQRPRQGTGPAEAPCLKQVPSRKACSAKGSTSPESAMPRALARRNGTRSEADLLSSLRKTGAYRVFRWRNWQVRGGKWALLNSWPCHPCWTRGLTGASASSALSSRTVDVAKSNGECREACKPTHVAPQCRSGFVTFSTW